MRTLAYYDTMRESKDPRHLRPGMVRMAKTEGVGPTARAFQTTPKTVGKRLGRLGGNLDSLEERSRRPWHSPNNTPEEADKSILAAKKKLPPLEPQEAQEGPTPPLGQDPRASAQEARDQAMPSRNQEAPAPLSADRRGYQGPLRHPRIQVSQGPRRTPRIPRRRTRCDDRPPLPWILQMNSPWFAPPPSPRTLSPTSWPAGGPLRDDPAKLPEGGGKRVHWKPAGK